MAFNFSGFLRFTRLALLNTANTNRRLTLKRLGWILVFYTLYPLVELAAWTGLGLDELWCGDYRQQKVWQPVFILGNPRSGTTFLHRLLARDRRTFASMRTWEILFAPSITARRACRWMLGLDRRLGGPLRRAISAGESYWQERNHKHRLALDAPEEDENLLLHTWSSSIPWSYAAMLEEARPFTFYDQMAPRAERERATAFYRRCLQRHLYCDGGSSGAGRRRYLAKNPSFNARIGTLLEGFPDARFVYVARNPLDAIPSLASLIKWVWELLGDPVEVDSLCRYAIELACHGYRYPLERLGRLPKDRYVILRFDDLVGDAEGSVTGIYRRLGFDLPPAYASVLREESERAHGYRSRHRYVLEELGLSREQIVSECADVFQRFGFDTRDP